MACDLILLRLWNNQLKDMYMTVTQCQMFKIWNKSYTDGRHTLWCVRITWMAC